MGKVSYLWRAATIFVIGALFGALVTVKWVIPPPSQDITIGKIKIRAKRGSQVTDAVDITKQDQANKDDSKGLFKRNKNKGSD